jgi:uncharacterized protein YndB with AHSA1/START domain
MSDPTRTLKLTRRIAASPERVFDAWLDPRVARQWLFATPTGKMVRAEIDARVGGRFNFTDRRDGQDVEHVGEYLEIDRPRRLVFTFSVPQYSDEVTRVTIDIAPTADGCELTLTHGNVLAEWFEQTRSGWIKLLGDLAAQVASQPEDVGQLLAPDTVRFERLLPGPIQRVWEYLVDSEKRSQWLAAGEMPTHVGGEFTLLFDDTRLSEDYVPPPEKYEGAECHPILRVISFEPPRRLGVTWTLNDQASEVLFELEPEGSLVRLTLTHSRLAGENTVSEFACGWHTHLVILADRLAGRKSVPFWTLFTRLQSEYALPVGVN